MPNVDLAKRRRIMQRSMKLGHCICDARRNCPCDVFTDQGICPCAGERPDPAQGRDVKLTELVHNAGCASKIAPDDLEQILRCLPEVSDPAVISGVPAGDDAGVYRMPGGSCIVQTVDVMTPCVDDARLFGRICAANCLSDVYAMGGLPKTALSILAFPTASLDGGIICEMMAGAMAALDQAGCALIGGHSIQDDQIKLGFAITGTIDAEAVARRDTAGVGDVLVLTKPLGAGTLNFSRQIGRPVDAGPLEASMAALNRDAAEAMKKVGASACTDITGFGLFGHLVGMVRRAGVTAQIYADALPAFPGAVEALRDGAIPGAVERNREYVADDISVADGVDGALVDLGFDAQTSGGLLIAVQADRLERLLSELAASGTQAAVVGKIVAASDGKIVVTNSDQPLPAARAARIVEELPHQPRPPAAEGKSTATDTKRAFGDLMQAAGRPGLLDEKTKELISVALATLARCEPCIKVHLAKADQMGITRSEIDEAAWLATAMGGAPVRMFYMEALKQADPAGGACCD